jgi:hypothetical protein
MVYTGIDKGVAFKLICISSVAFTNVTSYFMVPSNQADLDAASYKLISKDDGAFVPLTNSPVFVAPGVFSIQLTADEMNANKIQVVFAHNANMEDKFSSLDVIFTGSSTLTAQQVWEYAERTLTDAVSVNTGAPLTIITDCVRSNPYKLAIAVPTDSTPTSAVISKDGGDFVASGNSLVNILDTDGNTGTSFWYLDLTRREMDANTVCVLIRNAQGVVLYTVVLKPGTLIRNRFVPSER